ncbi:MAG: alpha/beta hydrolase [Planctomycetales bacterium]|nr:alpha/beta hydrolase [Planctomycetales bacterium]
MESNQEIQLEAGCKSFLDAIAENPGPRWHELTPSEGRKRFNSFQDVFGSGPEEIKITDTLMGYVPVRFYRPSHSTATIFPVVVYFHGGGWVLGDLDTHDALCRRLSLAANVVVISVDYRLAPEHPFPAALEDCFEVLRLIDQDAQKYGVDSCRVVVAGDSAGGNLAAAVALKLRDTSQDFLKGQVLIYPVMDHECNTRSYHSFATDFGLTRADMIWFWKQYLGEQNVTSYCVPTLESNLQGLPPTLVVTAEYDVLRDEGERYAELLSAAGIPVKHIQYPGAIHGFVHFAGVVEYGIKATHDIASEIRSMLEAQ